MPRIDLPGWPQHLWFRGNDRRACFVDDADRWLYLRLLRAAALQAGCAIHAYVLMTNHVHLVASGHCEGAISQMMRDAGSRYVVLTNRRHARTGTLFEGRFRASVIETDAYLLTCMRYVEANPVRAGMVARASEYRWSSFAANASGQPAGMVTAHALYWSLGPGPGARAEAYSRLSDAPLSADELKAIRAATAKNRALGRPGFCERLQGQLGRAVAPKDKGRPRKMGQGINVPDPFS